MHKKIFSFMFVLLFKPKSSAFRQILISSNWRKREYYLGQKLCFYIKGFTLNSSERRISNTRLVYTNLF